MTTSQRLSVRVEPCPDHLVLVMEGELMAGVAADVRAMIDAFLLLGAARIVVDVTALVRADEAGLHMLDVARGNAAAAGVALVLAGVPAAARPILLAADLPDGLPCYDTLDRAVSDAGRR